MSARDRRRERAELEAQEARLNLVHGVLVDMACAADDASEAKDYRDNEFEMSRIRHVGATGAQVHAEWTAVWNRVLDYRHDPASAAKIRAQLAAESCRPRRERSRGIERSR
ncbi:hypothetical protein IU459_18415 [Nocardia amamiensis]|uniref:Uncharacterized protein n=1 Tax=Nocardia amamiensis TaxID=404578 RepID=A0ABS0CS99_9NOCA|nr:hypothetical protein [Nocardia amamiensis]MBF6299500.1 hypothetical protein [Nocardia amamiensis]